MFINNLKDFKLRLLRIAAEHLKNKSYVCPLDVLTNVGVIQPIHIEEWKSGEIPYLEYVFDENLPKIRHALRWIREWALLRGLKPKEVHYLKIRRDGSKKNLDFTKKGAPQIELIYRVNYISPRLPEQKILALNPSPPPVVRVLKNYIQCHQCNKSVRKGSLGYLMGERSFCLRCGDALTLR